MATTLDDMLAAIRGSRGYVTVIARRLGVSRRHAHRLLNQWASAQDALHDEREERKDWIESKIDEAIQAGNPSVLIFAAKTMCKDRGYVERVEQTGVEGKAIAIKWELAPIDEAEFETNGVYEDE